MIRKGETTLGQVAFGLLLIIILVGVITAMTHHSEKKRWEEDPAKAITKTLKAKLQVVEQRTSFDGYDSDRPYRSRAVTAFYFFATDGCKLEVKDHMFIDYKEGDSVTSSRWTLP